MMYTSILPDLAGVVAGHCRRRLLQPLCLAVRTFTLQSPGSNPPPPAPPASSPEQEAAKLLQHIGTLILSSRFYAALLAAKRLIRSHRRLFDSGADVLRRLPDSPISGDLLLTTFSDLGLHDDALLLFETLRQPPSLTAVKVLLEALVSSWRCEDALSLFSRIVSSGPLPDTFVFNKAVQAAVNSGDLDKGFRIKALMEERENAKPDSFTYNVLISGSWKARRAEVARELFDEMLQREISPACVTFNAMIDGLGRFGDLDSAFRVCRLMQEEYGAKPTIASYNVLLGGLCRAGRIDETGIVLEEMKANGINLDGFAYGILILGHSACGDLQAAVDLFDESIATGVGLNTHTCSLMLKVLCKEGKLSIAEEIMVKVGKLGIVQTNNIYNILIDGHCKAGNFQAALSTVWWMESQGLKPDFVTYNSLINGLCKREMIPEAEEMIKEMRVKGVAPTLRTYNPLIGAHAQAGSFDRCFELLKDMQEVDGIKPCVVSYGSIVDGLCKEGLYRIAEELVRIMWAAEVLPNAQIYNILIHAYFNLGVEKHALALFEEMRSKGVPPTIVTYNSLVSGLCRVGRLDEAEALLVKLHGEGLIPNVITYNALIAAHCGRKDLPKALEIFKEMERVGVKSNLSTFYHLLNLMAVEGKMQEAGYLYRKMLKTKVTPHKGIYQALLYGYKKVEDHSQVLFLQKEMIERGIFLNGITGMFCE